MAMIVYPDDQRTPNPQTYFIKQAGGSGIVSATSVASGGRASREASGRPKRTSLEQNYPNPFNPMTSIRYSIPQDQQVSLKVVNLLGQDVRTLIDEERPAGTYTVEWDAAALPSGVYFYRLEAGTHVEMRKMILSR
jgi:hypothetical protein